MDVSNRLKLVRALETAGVRSTAYSASGPVDLALCIEKTENEEWEVFYSERGIKTFSKKFGSEKEACFYMYDQLMKDPTSFM